MGIDPLTHKSISSVNEKPEPEKKEQEQEQSSETRNTSEIDQSKETETSFQSSSIAESKEEEKSMKSSFETITTIMEVTNNGFCTDEVPLVEPHEIVVPSSSTSSSSSSSSNSSSNFLEDLELPDFEWPSDHYNNSNSNNSNNNNINNMCLWDEDFNVWDLLINDDHIDGGDRKQSVHDDLSLNQCQRMVLDQESWALLL